MTKKNIFTIFLLAILLACNQAKKKTQSTTQPDTTDVAVTATPHNTVVEYQNYVSGLDTFDVETATEAAKKYQELFKGEDVAARDKGFIIFNNHYESLDRTINKLHEKDTTDFEPLITLDASEDNLPVPQKLRAYSEKLKRNGFVVSSTEGMSYIQQDRDFIIKWFYSFVSPVTKEYLQQVNKENKQGFQEDAGLTIEAEEYVNRLVWWENFIRENPDFPLVAKAKDHRKYLLTFFLEGMDNAPVITYETNTLDDYYKTAYSYLQSKFPNSETNKVVNPYFKALLQKDNKKATSLLNDYRKKGVIVDFAGNL
jgi:hypothetical protein